MRELPRLPQYLQHLKRVRREQGGARDGGPTLRVLLCELSRGSERCVWEAADAPPADTIGASCRRTGGCIRRERGRATATVHITTGGLS